MKRAAIGVASILALVACRDILGIAGDTTIGTTNDGGPGDATFDGPLTTPCGTIALVTWINEPIAFTADPNGVFWAEVKDAETGAIYGWVDNKRISITDSTPTPIDVRVDDNFVYWNAWNQFPTPDIPSLNAWPRNTTVPKPVSVPLGNITAGRISPAGDKLYFGTWQTQNGGIYAMSLPLDGSAPQQVMPNIDSPYHVLFEANRVYYDEGSDKNGEGTQFSVLDVDAGTTSVIHASTTVDDITAINDVGFWANALAGEVKRSDGTIYDVPNPTAISIDPGSTFLFVASNADLVRIQVDDTTQTICFSADVIDQLSSIVGRTYFTAKYSGSWAIFSLELQ